MSTWIPSTRPEYVVFADIVSLQGIWIVDSRHWFLRSLVDMLVMDSYTGRSTEKEEAQSLIDGWIRCEARLPTSHIKEFWSFVELFQVAMDGLDLEL